MVIDDVMLLAWVDGELDESLHLQVQAAVDRDPALQARVQALRASCLPYRAAFEAQQLPPLPPALVGQLDELLALSRDRSTATAASAGGREGPMAPALRRRWLLGGMAASVAVGLLALPWVGRPGDALSALSVLPGWDDRDDREPWIAAIAQYHALYVRETVAQSTEPPRPLQDLLEGWDAGLRQRLHVPDLRARGLAFRRAQRLGLGEAPLIQLVYLPEQGRPLALCFLVSGGAPRAPRFESIGTQSVASWTDAGLAFVVVGELAMPDLRQLVPLIRSQVLTLS